MLSELHRQRRLEWCLAHQNQNWDRVVFSDETAIQLFRNTVRRWSLRPEDEVHPIPKNRTKLMVWGAFSSKDTVGYYSFKEIMDSTFYINILKNHLLAGAKEQFGRRWTFQQDNDPKHKSKITMNWIKDNVPILLEWPANSPDLNPIENLWAILKKRVEKRHPRNISELSSQMQEEWERIDLTHLQNLAATMKFRITECIEKKGYRINY